MTKKASLYEYDLEQLEQVHPEVTNLRYRVSDVAPDWNKIGRAFPNVEQLYFGSYLEPLRPIDAEMFSAFPNLKILNCETNPLELSEVKPEMVKNLKAIRGAVVTQADQLGYLKHCPALTEIYLDVEKGSLALELPEGSRLQTLHLRVDEVDRLALNLSGAKELTELHLYGLHYNGGSYTMQVEQLLLPDSIKKISISPNCQMQIERIIDAGNAELNEMRLEADKLTVAPGGLIRAKSVKELHLNVGRDGTEVASDLFCQLGSAERLMFLPHNASYNLTELVAPLQSLTSIYLFSEGKGVVGDLNLPHLDHLFATGVPFTQLDGLKNSPKLTKLELRDSGELGEAKVLSALTNLEYLQLEGFTDAELPLTLRQHSGITRLRVSNGPTEQLGDLSAMTGVTEIRIEQFSHHGPCTALPALEQLLTAPSLKHLNLNLTAQSGDRTDFLMHMPPEIEVEFGIYDQVARSEALNKQRRILLNAPLTLEQRQTYWQQLYHAPKPRDLPEMDGRFHLTFLEAKYSPFKKHAHAWLRANAEQALTRRALGSDTVLFVCGKSGFKVTELKAKAEELGFSISKKLDDSVTHVLVGANPKQTELLDLQQHLLIDDTALSQWFEQAAPQFLQQEQAIDSGMVDTVMTMLNSPDEASHQVAVEMLAQGGVTEVMWMPLFLILKTTSDKALRKSIQQLLAGKGDDLFQLAVKDRIFFESDLRGLNWEGNPTGEGPMFKKLKGLTKRWGRPLCIDFSKAYFDRYGEGLVWLLTQKEECERRQAITRSFVEGECLNWNRACGFELMVKDADEERLINCHGSPDIYMQNSFELGKPKTRLPQALPEQMRITELDLHNTYLNALPANFERYQQVKKLNLNFNHLEKLPPKLAELTELEELDLSFNHFTEFPKVLFKLKNLKKLDLRRAAEPLYRWGYDAEQGYESIRAPQKFRDAFPDCEILEDA